jgi:WD40 repeat protein
MQLLMRRIERLCSGWLSCKLPILLIALTLASIGGAQADTKPELVLQTGHSSWVNRVALSPDGRWLASSSDDSTIKIWALTGRLEFRTLHGGSDCCGAVAFSPDGRLLALADGNIVKLWEAGTGRELFNMPTGNHVMGIVDVAFEPDGKRLISLNQDHTVTIWEVSGGQRVSSFIAGGGLGPAYFTRLTRDGHRVMSGVYDDTQTTRRLAVELWDVPTGQRVYRQLFDLTNQMNNPTLSPDGRWVVTTDEHMAIRCWDAVQGSVVYSVLGDPKVDTNKNYSFSFSPDGKVLAVGDDDKQTVRLLDAATGRVLQTFERTFAGGLSFSDDGRRIAAVRDRSIAVLDLSTGHVLQTLHGYERGTSAIAISRDGHLLAAGDEDCSVKLWDLGLGREVGNFGGNKIRTDMGYAAVTLSPDGHWLAAAVYEANASGFMEDRVRVWEVGTGRESVALTGFDIGVHSVSFSPDGRLLAAASRGAVRIWEQGTWREMRPFELPDPWVVGCVAFSPDGQLLAASAGSSIYVWNVGTRELATTIRETSLLGLDAIAFSPDSKRLASAGILKGTHTIHIWIWEAENGNQVLSIPSQPARVTGLAFSPNGRWLAGAGQDHTVRLWDATSGQALQSFTGHSSEVKAVAFTPDGQWLTSAGADGSVRIWDPTAGTAVALLASISGSSDWVVVTPDGLFDGSTEGAQKLVAWRVGNNLYPADRFYASNYTPGLLSRLMGGEKLAKDI